MRESVVSCDFLPCAPGRSDTSPRRRFGHVAHAFNEGATILTLRDEKVLDDAGMFIETEKVGSCRALPVCICVVAALMRVCIALQRLRVRVANARTTRLSAL